MTKKKTAATRVKSIRSTKQRMTAEQYENAILDLHRELARTQTDLRFESQFILEIRSLLKSPDGSPLYLLTKIGECLALAEMYRNESAARIARANALDAFMKRKSKRKPKRARKKAAKKKIR